MIPRAALCLRLGSRRIVLGLPRRHALGRVQPHRHNSSQPSQPSHTSQFYKTFGRPIFKVSLMAILVYQIAYWAWVKLDQDEIKAERQGEIADLEAKLESLQASQGATKAK